MQTRRKQTIEAYDFLLPERTPRRASVASPAQNALVEDAVYEVVRAGAHDLRQTNDNPPRKRRPQDRGLLPFAAHLGGMVAALVERQLSRLSPQAFSTLLASLFFFVFWLCGGFAVFETSPSVATSDAAFEVTDVSIATENANGMKLAVVYGSVTNMGKPVLPAPLLEVRDGRRVIGRIRLNVASLGSQEKVGFSGRFKLDGEKSSDIAVIPRRR